MLHLSFGVEFLVDRFALAYVIALSVFFRVSASISMTDPVDQSLS
jgi:hypothetical protein